MSIQSQITRISGNVSDALTAVGNKGVTVPSGSNSDDLAGLIAQIQSGGTTSKLNVVSSVVWTNGKYYNDNGVLTNSANSKYEEDYIPVEASTTYTISITDSSNNKIRIHTYKANKSRIGQIVNTYDKTATFTTESTAAYIRLSLPVNATDILLTTDVTQSVINTKIPTTYHPSATDQTIAGNQYLLGDQTINAVTLSNTLVAENIKNGVTINIGDSEDDDCITSITGTYSGGGGTLQAKTGITPLITSQTITADSGYDGLSSVQIDAIPASLRFVLLGSGTLTVNTTSTSAASAGTIDCGSAAWDKTKIIYVRIRDKAGPRAGYFYGSDAFFTNYQQANSSTSTNTYAARSGYFYNSSNAWATASSSYGVYGYSISSAGVVTVRRRYNSSYGTINGNFLVQVYAIGFPDGYSPFDTGEIT